MARLLGVAVCVLAASSCRLIGSKPPPGFACEPDGTCASGLTCCIDGFCRASCGGAGGGSTGGVGGGTSGAGGGGGGDTCTPNVPCSGNPGAPCHVGRTQCSGSVSTCVDAELALDGTPCGGGNVCANGTCAVCMPNGPCGTNVDPCAPGVLSCTDGGAMCVDSAGLRDAGATCGVDQVCTVEGACIACAQGGACSSNPNVCLDGKTDCAGGVVSCFDATTRKAAGAGCGQNHVCDGDGGCVSCTQGGVCPSNPDPCKAGTLDCTGGGAVCRDGAAKSAGATCGTNKVCSPMGACVDCPEAAPCTTNPTACKVGVTACMSGTPSCVDTTTNLTPGAGCGTNKVCNASGACISCTAGATCGGNPNVCKLGATNCSSGTPVCGNSAQNASNGTPCGMSQTCNSGVCGTCAPGSACTDNPTPCKVGSQNCQGAMPACDDTTTNVGPGVSCGPNQVCNGSGSCVSCAAGAGCSGNPSECKQGTTSCSTGGPACSDGSDQALGALCSGGFCSAGSCVACALGAPCSSNPNPCMTGITARSGGSCACNDDQARGVGQVFGCTAGSTCDGAGHCVGCTQGCQPANPCQDGAVDCATLGCVATGAKADLTVCTLGVCRAGDCCTGCWSGTACLAGTAKSACGESGATCVSCPGICKPGISGTSCFDRQCDTCL